jgi:cytochrome c553
MPMKRSRQAISIVFMLVAMAAGYSSNAATQPSRVQPASADDLRAVYANAADVADGKRVAETSCSGCHGANGISTTADVPHLAGQRAAYLHFELRAYKSGTAAITR